MTTATDPKSIRYDHGDYRAEYDGILVGYYPYYLAAEEALDAYAYDLIASGETVTATEMDAPVEPAECTINCPGCPNCTIEVEDEGVNMALYHTCYACGDTLKDATAYPVVCRACYQSGERAPCPVCTGTHHIQICPSMISALYAPPRPDEDLTPEQELRFVTFRDSIRARFAELELA